MKDIKQIIKESESLNEAKLTDDLGLKMAVSSFCWYLFGKDNSKGQAIKNLKNLLGKELFEFGDKFDAPEVERRTLMARLSNEIYKTIKDEIKKV